MPRYRWGNEAHAVVLLIKPLALCYCTMAAATIATQLSSSFDRGAYASSRCRNGPHHSRDSRDIEPLVKVPLIPPIFDICRCIARFRLENMTLVSTP